MSKVLAAIQDMSNQASKITCPMLLLQGEKDTLSPERGSILFMAKISSADKTLKVFYTNTILAMFAQVCCIVL